MITQHSYSYVASFNKFNLFAGGDVKLLLMVCVSPTKKYITETVKCLQFGSQARQIARKPSVRPVKKQQQSNHVIHS